MTFNKRFNIKSDKLKTLLHTGDVVDLARKQYELMESVESEFSSIKSIYKRIKDSSPLSLDASWSGDINSYVLQSDYIVEVMCHLNTDYIICGPMLASYLRTSRYFSPIQNDPIGIYKIGVISSGAEAYKAPGTIIPDNEFLYYDLSAENFKIGRVLNIKKD